MVRIVISLKKQQEIDEKILKVVRTFLEYDCRITDSQLSEILNISSSTIGRYLTGNRTRTLIGVDNFAYIKRERKRNQEMGRRKGGSRKKNG